MAAKKATERAIIAQTLKRCDGNRVHAARELGCSLRSLHLKIEEYGL